MWGQGQENRFIFDTLGSNQELTANKELISTILNFWTSLALLSHSIDLRSSLDKSNKSTIDWQLAAERANLILWSGSVALNTVDSRCSKGSVFLVTGTIISTFLGKYWANNALLGAINVLWINQTHKGQ